MRVRKTARARSLALARGLHGTRGRAAHMGWLGFPKSFAQAWGSKSGCWVDSGTHCHLGHTCIWKCAMANLQQCPHMNLASAGSRHGAKDAVYLILDSELGERYRAHCGVMVWPQCTRLPSRVGSPWREGQIEAAGRLGPARPQASFLKKHRRFLFDLFVGFCLTPKGNFVLF